jgi:hypothetical protein
MSTLNDIRRKVRKIVGVSANQLPNSELDDYINEFLRFELPSHSKLLYNRVTYSEELTPNVGVYSIEGLKDDYMNVEPPTYIDNYEIRYSQDEQTFFRMYPHNKFSTNFATGAGIVGPYAGTFNYTPIEPESVVISTTDAAGSLITAKDDGTGGFVNQTGAAIAGATINYATGVIAGINFTAVVPIGNVIYISANTYVIGRPFTVLYSNNEFRFYPYPDRAYTFKITVYKNPDELLSGTAIIELTLWSNVISYGTAMKIFAENLDMESYSRAQVFFEEQKILAQRRTVQQLSTQRAATIYSDNTGGFGGFHSFPYGS